MHNTPKDTLNLRSEFDDVGERLHNLEQRGVFPRQLENIKEDLIINYCKEQRWLINFSSEAIHDGLRRTEISSSTQSLARIDEVTKLLDQILAFEHTWSRMVTYLDLVKIFENSVQIRLRYEFTGNELTVKWIVVDNSRGEDKVFVLIAENEQTVREWEGKFLMLNASHKKVSIKVFKYFLINPDGLMMPDYSYNEIDNDRVEIDIDSTRIGFKTTENFAGVFVQDRFSLPLAGVDREGLLDFPQIIDLIKNELHTSLNRLLILNNYNLKHEEIRIELETHVDKKATVQSDRFGHIASSLERSLSEAERGGILIRK